MYNVSCIALLISLFKLFYAFNHNFLMLFSRSVLVPCHSTRDKHWKYRAVWNYFGSLWAHFLNSLKSRKHKSRCSNGGLCCCCVWWTPSSVRCGLGLWADSPRSTDTERESSDWNPLLFAPSGPPKPAFIGLPMSEPKVSLRSDDDCAEDGTLAKPQSVK